MPKKINITPEQFNQLSKENLITYIIQSEAYLQEENNQWKKAAERELEINQENEEKLKSLRKLRVEREKLENISKGLEDDKVSLIETNQELVAEKKKLQKNNRKLETDIQKLKANVSIYEGKLTDKDAEIQKLRNRTLIQELEQARNNLKMALEKEEQTKHENANLINQINLLKEEQFTMIKKKKNNQLFELPANLNFEKKLNINVKHNIMKKVTQINQKLEEKNQKLERENEELREKLRKMLSSRNKLQKENRELKRELYVEDSDSDEGGGRWLWEKLESYFLLRELTKEDVEEIYGRKDFESIIKNTSEEDLEAGTSKRIFQAAVDIRAADKVLQTITDLRKYEGTEYSLDDQETQDTLGLLEKIKEGLEKFSLQNGDETHDLYLEIIKKKQDKLDALNRVFQESQQQTYQEVEIQDEEQHALIQQKYFNNNQ